MKYKEIETKYNASEISLEDFIEFCEAREPNSQVIASGYDHFYDKEGDDTSFCRHRVGPDLNQLSFKRKTQDTNNFIRTEHNINLNGTTVDQIEALCKDLGGYTYNFSIFKNCFVYKYDRYTLVYYVCYTKDLKELGRFVEIEMSEDGVWRNEDEAWMALRKIEIQLKTLGVSANARIRRSLFEMFRKEDKAA